MRQQIPEPVRIGLGRLIYDPATQWLLRMGRRHRFLAEQATNPGVFAIDIDAGNGFFAQMGYYLKILLHCDSVGLLPRVRCISRQYGSGTGDWLSDYFVAKVVPSNRQLVDTHVTRITNISDLGLNEIDRGLELSTANKIMTKYLAVRSNVLDEVDSFTARFGAMLGVHYRGTDKSREARRVPYAEVYANVRSHLASNDLSGIFVATDEPSFLAAFLAQRWPLPVVRYDDREVTGRPVHRSDGDPMRKGREALVNCLLLSRCVVCIRTASYLSGWASIFNPDLRVIMLNRTRRRADSFPDREIWAQTH